MLDNHNISYTSNPKEWKEWLKTTNTDYDIKVIINGSTIEVEAKFALTHIWHSWFMRDWYSRNCDVIVTNNKYVLDYRDRKLLQQKGVKLFSTHEFLIYLLKLCMKGNKNGYLNTLKEEELDQYPYLNLYCDVTGQKLYQYYTSNCKGSMYLCLAHGGRCGQCHLRATYFRLKREEEEEREYLRSYIQFLFTFSLLEYLEDN